MDEKDKWLSKTIPLGEARIEIAFQRTFTPAEVERLRIGLWPDSMDDKWVVRLGDSALEMWRSWTGHCIYHLPAQPSDGGVTVGPLIVCGDRTLYRRISDERDIQAVETLISRTLRV
jgi:hypothetical protein